MRRLPILAGAAWLAACSAIGGSGAEPERCSGGVDDDYDGRVDCADPDCQPGVDGCPVYETVVREPLLSSTCTGADGWVDFVSASPFTPSYCHPWRREDGLDCESGWQRPGASRCAPVGSDSCALSGGLGPDAVFVDTDAPAGGDGTFASPFGSITEALAARPDAGFVLFRGVVGEPVILDRPLVLRGACARADGTDLAVLAAGAVLAAPSARLENLRVEPGEDGVALRFAPSAEGDDPALDRAAVDVVIDGAVRFEGRAAPSEPGSARDAGRLARSLVRGPVVASGHDVDARLEGSQVHFEGACVRVEDGATTAFENVVVRGCRESAVRVTGAAQAELRHVFFDAIDGLGLVVACDPPPGPGLPDPDGACVRVDSSVLRSAIEGDVSGAPLLRLESGVVRVGQSVLEGGAGRLMEVESGLLVLRDVDAFNGETDRGGATLLIRGGDVDAARTTFTPGSLGIDLAGGSFQGRDIAVIGIGTTQSERVAGIRAASGTRLVIVGARFQEAEPCAFDLAAGVLLSVRELAMKTQVAAFCVPSPDAYPMAQLSDRVTLEPSVGEHVRVRRAE